MARWDSNQNKVVGNNDIKFCCLRIKTAEDANTEETLAVNRGVKEVKKSVAEATGGVGGTLGNIVTFGGVTRAGNAGESAAIQVIHNRVPGVTKRVVSLMQCTVPIGLAIMILGVYMANTQELEKGNENYYYFGIPLGAYFAYSPAISEENSIKKEAEQAGANAGALLPNICSIQ